MPGKIREGSKILVCLVSRKDCNPELRRRAGLRGQLREASHGYDAGLGPGRSNYWVRGRLWRESRDR